MSRTKRRGFTLIEVTLAIVIGIIMVAGATLIYNQAKTSAGNSRAQAKVTSCQAVIEQYMARADGVAPDITALRAMWQRARPDDFNKSAWGGAAFPTTDVNDVPNGSPPSNGIIRGDTIPDDVAGFNGGVITNNQTVALPPTGQEWTGTLIYYKIPNANPMLVWDETTRGTVTVKSYVITTSNQRGERWFFVKGQPTGGVQNGAASIGVQGQVGP